jgi:hypothetical protein
MYAQTKYECEVYRRHPFIFVIQRRTPSAEGSMQLAGGITGAGKVLRSFVGSHSLRERLCFLQDDKAEQS